MRRKLPRQLEASGLIGRLSILGSDRVATESIIRDAAKFTEDQ